MAKLAFTVCGEQQHFCLRSFRQLVQFLLIVGQQLRVLTSLVLQPAKTNLRDRTELSRVRQSAPLLKQRGGSVGHGLVHLAFVRLDKFERDQASTHRTLCFQCRFLPFVSQRFVLLQRIELFSPCGEDGCRRDSCIFAIRIWIPGLGDLRVNISGFVFPAESFKAAGFKITRRKRHRRFLRFGRGTVKKRERRGVVFIGERNLRERKCRGPGEFAVAVLGERFL